MTGHAHTPPASGHQGHPLGPADAPSRAVLWRAVSDLALTWATTPVVQRFAVDLPRNAGQRNRGIPGRLQEMDVRGAGVSSQPLRLTKPIQLVEQMSAGPFPQVVPDPAEWKAWLATAAAVEIAHGIMTAWLRSRMSGYPNILAPQLAPGAPLTIDEFGQPRPWTRDERRQGLQLREPPPEITLRLKAAAPEARQITNATRVLGTALQGISEWQRMDAAADALTGPARAELRQGGRTVTERLSEAEVCKFSPQDGPDYRAVVLEEVLYALSGPAAEYAQAFEAANHALETAASNVFGQLTVYGRPTPVSGTQDIDLTPGNPGQLVSFTRPVSGGEETQFHLDIGQLIWLDELIPDAVQLTKVEYSFNMMRERERYTGTVVPWTGEAWEH